MFQSAARGDGRLPEGVVIASFATYDEAQKAVTKVSDSDAEVRGLAIIGNDLKLVERIVGKLNYGKVALAGLWRGLMFGLFLGLVTYLLTPESVQAAIVLPLLGGAFGMLLGVITHSITRRKRDFQSVQQVLAARYDVVAPQSIAPRASQAIGQQQTPTVPAAPANPEPANPAPANPEPANPEPTGQQPGAVGEQPPRW